MFVFVLNIIKGAINANLNSSVIENLRIDFAETNGDLFPEDFSVDFNQFNKDFKIAFRRMSPNDINYPIKSHDVYIIDTLTGDPIKYDINTGEVRSVYE